MTNDDDPITSHEPRRVWPWVIGALVVILFVWFMATPITFECDPNDDHLGQGPGC